MQRLWNKISRNGISENNGYTEQDTKRLVFFNQVLFIGFVATFLQIPSIWPFLGVKSFSFLFVCAALIACLMLNKYNQFGLSKWIYVLSVFSFGIYTTTLLGGAALYHTQSIIIFFSCLILFDWQKEKYQILTAIPLMIFSIAIGEFSLFNAPDLSAHPSTPVIRFINIVSIISVSTIFIYFIIRLNKFSENALSKVLNEVLKNSKELQKGKSELESIVQDRTSKLISQTEVLQSQNDEKIILLKEIHHRVRNNLQIIISLINLQIEGIQNEKTSEALREIQSRVGSMSLVHQKMYQSANFKEINLVNYSTQIIDNMKNLYGNDGFNYDVNIPKDFKLEMDEAIPMGLIINEIISNFFKHGIISEDSYFNLSLKQNDKGFELNYSDNGPGFGNDFDASQLCSLGLQLISSLSEQLDGMCVFSSKNGANYLIQIPKPAVIIS